MGKAEGEISLLYLCQFSEMMLRENHLFPLLSSVNSKICSNACSYQVTAVASLYAEEKRGDGFARDRRVCVQLCLYE